MAYTIRCGSRPPEAGATSATRSVLAAARCWCELAWLCPRPAGNGSRSTVTESYGIVVAGITEVLRQFSRHLLRLC
jgi:hypothetical protein